MESERPTRAESPPPPTALLSTSHLVPPGVMRREACDVAMAPHSSHGRHADALAAADRRAALRASDRRATHGLAIAVAEDDGDDQASGAAAMSPHPSGEIPYVRKTGYLVKRGHRRHNWLRRHFVLHENKVRRRLGRARYHA